MTKEYLIATIYNLCVIGLFVALAIAFKMWGLVFICLLFMYYPDCIHKHYRICDKCGKHSEYSNTRKEALEKAKASGWVHSPEGNKDYCPDCLSKMKIQIGMDA